jgi:hypothetical protein
MKRTGRSASKRPRYSPRTSGLSTAGSVVTKTTCRSSTSDGSNPRSATATSAMVVGHTSGQFVYPKNSRVGRPAVAVVKSKAAPVVSVSVKLGRR